MKLTRRSQPPDWRTLLGTAALSGAFTLFITRNFFPAEKIRHRTLRPTKLQVHRAPLRRIASDHYPLIADFMR